MHLAGASLAIVAVSSLFCASITRAEGEPPAAAASENPTASATASPSATATDAPQQDLSRQVELQWEPLDKATQYEFVFGLTPELDKPLYDQKLESTKFRLTLQPGSYFYRVRGFDYQGHPGAWSDTHELNINARPPVLIWPKNEAVLQGNLPDSGIPMEWHSSGQGIRYLIEIKQADDHGQFNKTIVKQEVDGTIFAFFPQDIGRYQWSVHTIGAAGDEPGVPWVFSVEGVIPHGATIEPGMTPKRIVRYVSPWWRNHWWVWLTYGQSSMNYSIVDQDLRANSSFNGFTGYIAARLNWEWHDPVSWTGGGTPWIEGEIELDRETVLSESIILGRKYLRAGSWYDHWLKSFRFSPTIEGGTRDISIYQPRSTIEAVRSTTTRTDLGLGITGEYDLKQFLSFGVGFVLHFMSGGEGGFVPVSETGDQLSPYSPRAGNLSNSLGSEIDGTTTISLSPRMKIMGRIRFESYSSTWVPHFPISPLTTQPDGLTTFSTQDLSFDVSFGYHF
jgi:hypothetical protein